MLALVVVIAADQTHNETGSRPAQRDSSYQGQECEPDAAVGAAAEDESDATGYRQRGQRFLFYVFADVPIAPAPPLIVIRQGGLC